MLLHDIQARTVEALPNLLHELKRRGYHIVHVTPATPERPKTVTEPSQWIAHAHGRQTWPGSVIVLPQPSQTSVGNNQPLDVRPAVAAPIQQRGRPDILSPPWKPGLPALQPRPNRYPQRPSWRPGIGSARQRCRMDRFPSYVGAEQLKHFSRLRAGWRSRRGLPPCEGPPVRGLPARP